MSPAESGTVAQGENTNLEIDDSDVRPDPSLHFFSVKSVNFYSVDGLDIPENRTIPGLPGLSVNNEYSGLR